MSSHNHARPTYARRIETAKQMTFEGLDAAQVGAAHGVTSQTARTRLSPYLGDGEAALADASSRPGRSPNSIEESKALLIVELRMRRIFQERIARYIGVSAPTVNLVLDRSGLSWLSDLAPEDPVVRYEHEAPGDMLHIDTKEARTHRVAQPPGLRQTARLSG